MDDVTFSKNRCSSSLLFSSLRIVVLCILQAGTLTGFYSSLPCSGVCCTPLEEPKALMKMGLSMVLIGHVNFLLGALVHGVVLRHINLHKQARAMEYAISNVVALTSGLVVSGQTHTIHTDPRAVLQY